MPSSADELVTRYQAGDPVARLAADLGVHESTVHTRLRRLGVPPRYAHREIDADRAEITRRLEAGETTTAIAADYGVDRAVIYERRLAWDLIELGELGASPAQLRQMYEQWGWPVRRIADRLGVSTRTARRRLVAAGVTLRPAGRPRSA